MKKILYFIIVVLGVTQVQANSNPISYKSESTIDTSLIVSNIEDVNGCVSYVVRYNKDIRSYVVDFTNNCDSYVDISYQFYSEDRGKWINGASWCAVGKTNYNNAAGSGQIRNVTYTFR